MTKAWRGRRKDEDCRGGREEDACVRVEWRQKGGLLPAQGKLGKIRAEGGRIVWWRLKEGDYMVKIPGEARENGDNVQQGEMLEESYMNNKRRVIWIELRGKVWWKLEEGD